MRALQNRRSNFRAFTGPSDSFTRFTTYTGSISPADVRRHIFRLVLLRGDDTEQVGILDRISSRQSLTPPVDPCFVVLLGWCAHDLFGLPLSCPLPRCGFHRRKHFSTWRQDCRLRIHCPSQELSAVGLLPILEPWVLQRPTK